MVKEENMVITYLKINQSVLGFAQSRTPISQHPYVNFSSTLLLLSLHWSCDRGLPNY